MIKQTIDEATAANPLFCENWEDYNGISRYKMPSEYVKTISTTPLPPKEKDDNVNHPLHYTEGGIETIDYIRAKLTKEEFKGYCKGNIFKYLSRAGKKGSEKEDLQKAETYIEWLIEAM